jgi:HEPN domain-containing protein
MKKETECWLNAAEDDLGVIREIIGNGNLTNMVAFHSQQAIEKCMKAILEEREANVLRTHNIITLRGKVEKYIDIGVCQDIFDQINELYIDSRYPTDIGLLPQGKPSMEIAREFFDVSIEICSKIRGYLSE